jgi:protein involved in polysaccharide export with SLBB domain
VLDEPNAKLLKVAITFDSQGHCKPADDLKLEDGDVVTIQGKGGYVDAVQTITVIGAVNSPGPIPLTSKEMRLTDAIKAAGGMRKEAYPLGAEFHRNPKIMLTDTQQDLALSIGKLRDLLNGTQFQRESAKARLDIITATGQAQADSASAGLLGGLTGGLGAATAAAIPNAAAGAVGSSLAGGQVPVSPARLMGQGQNEPDGALAVNLPKALLNPGGHEDILLKDGDAISIPETPTTVQLMGAIYHPSGVVWQPGKSLMYYVNSAGGFTFDAAKDGIEVIRAGGGIIPAKKVREILPGDVILVPTKPIAASISQHSNALNDFFKSLTSSVLIYGIAKSVFGL